MLERLRQEVSPYRHARRWLVAYSGGLDSHVLLHTLSALAKTDPGLPPLLAVHVNHQIQPLANHWEEHCRVQAAVLGVDYIACRVGVDVSGNVEEHARSARYGVFAGLLEENDCIFMAHQQDDNVETFFYRLFRGAGVHGLVSIGRQRPLGKGTLVRPLLPFPRSELEAYARDHGLAFVLDPTNADIHYDRNFIRHQVVPAIQQRWPALNAVIARTLCHLDEANALLEEVAQTDLACASGEEEGEPYIELGPVLQLSAARQKNLLRHWLLRHHIVLSSRQTQELIENVILASVDAEPMMQAGCQVLRRYRQRLYITAANPARFETIVWNGLDVCEIPGVGVLRIMPPVAVMLEVRQRQGGEQIRPAGSAHTRKLKTLLQEMQVPPWRRDSLPLVFYRGNLIAVAGRVMSDDGKSLLHNARIDFASQNKAGIAYFPSSR